MNCWHNSKSILRNNKSEGKTRKLTMRYSIRDQDVSWGGGGYGQAVVHVWWSEDSLHESVLFFSPYRCLGLNSGQRP